MATPIPAVPITHESFFFKLKESGSYGFAKFVNSRVLRKSGYRLYWFYVNSEGKVDLVPPSTTKIWDPNCPSFGATKRLKNKPSRAMVLASYRHEPVPESADLDPVSISAADFAATLVDEETTDLDGKTEQVQMSQIQMAIMSVLKEGELSTSQIAKQLNKPAAAVNSPLTSLAKMERVVLRKTDSGQFWSISA